jgi:hypothetical protein
VCESVDGFAARGLRGSVVVHPAVSPRFEGGEIFHPDHLRARRGSVVDGVTGEMEGEFPVDLAPFDTDRGAVGVEDRDLLLQCGTHPGWCGRSEPRQTCGFAVQVLTFRLQAGQPDSQAPVVVGEAPVVRDQSVGAFGDDGGRSEGGR